MGSNKPLVIKFLGFVFQLVELVALHFKPEIGEEIVLIGIKTRRR